MTETMKQLLQSLCARAVEEKLAVLPILLAHGKTTNQLAAEDIVRTVLSSYFGALPGRKPVITTGLGGPVIGGINMGETQ